MSNMDTPVDYQDIEHMKEDEDPAAQVQELADALTEGTVSVPYSGEHIAKAWNEEQREVAEQLANEAQFQQEAKKAGVVTVDTNFSRQVRFRRYQIPQNQVVRICENKPYRGDLVVTVVSGGPCSVGTQPGILPNGADTGTVTGSRTIRTSERLYATSDQVSCIIDIQEEFS